MPVKETSPDKHSVAGDEERLFRASEKEKQAPDLHED
jgi:hypothetical protein